MIERFLESSSVGGSRRYPVHHFPLIIGRQPDAGIQLVADRVSRTHAEIDLERTEQLTIRDLGSTNGTFVNGKAVAGTTPIRHGDVIHIGDVELRLLEIRVEQSPRPDAATQFGFETLPHEFPLTAREFNELLDQSMVRGFRQIIVDQTGSVFGHELLGRGNHTALGESPGALFKVARALGEEIRLSEVLRECCFREAAEAGIREPLFFNTHPAESADAGRLLQGLRRLAARHPDLELIFEVHESAVTNLGQMAEIRAELDRLGIGLAYDDFGAGQARLRELTEVPPNYLKFDISLVRGITEPRSPRLKMLETLNRMMRDFGICTLAEGIEDRATAEACRDIGIDLFQGFYFGRPRPILDPKASVPRH